MSDPNPLAHLWWWFEIHTGMTPKAPVAYYNFWSGFGSDMGEITLLGIFVGLLRHVNCHTKGCWRVGRHVVEGTPYKVCRKHHPDIPNKAPTAQDIRIAYEAAKTR